MGFKGNYKYFTQYNAANYSKGRGVYGSTPREIVLHHWGVDGQRFQDVVNFFTRSSTQTSAHYVVCAGNVACLVDCADTAWHAGNWDENCKSIGIECRPECSEADIDTVAQLVAEIWQDYPQMSRKLRFHKEFYNTACPGRWQNKLRDIERLATQYLSGKKTTPPKTVPVFKELRVGDNATIRMYATHLKNGTPITDGMKGKTGKIIQAISINQSCSKKAYLLEGLKDYVLEQDVEQAYGKTPATITPLFIPSKSNEPVQNNNNSIDSVVVGRLDSIEKLVFGNAKIQRNGEYIGVLQEIAEIRNSVEEIKKVLGRVFK